MKRKDDPKSAVRSQLTRRIVAQYFFTLAIFGLAYMMIVLVGWRLYSSVNWKAEDLIFIIAQSLKKLFPGLLIIPLLIGWALITYRFMAKPLLYLDEVIEASEQLVTSTESPIRLPPAMKSVQDELNLIREQALRNELLAKEAEKRKNDLIVYLAHDLKTPLTSVIGYLSLLYDEPEISQELRTKYVGIALGKAERLEELMNEFFDITRFNLTELELQRKPVHISRMLEQIANEFIPILAEKALRWQMNIEPDIVFLCDPDKIERVLDNLIRNAVNYSDPNTEIALSLRQEEDRIIIQIQNSGDTISPEKLSQIFEQFFRLDTSRSTQTGGAGLGLAIAKEITELHGGTIQAKSENHSVMMTVTLPGDCHKIV